MEKFGLIQMNLEMRTEQCSTCNVHLFNYTKHSTSKPLINEISNWIVKYLSLFITKTENVFEPSIYISNIIMSTN